MRESPEQTQITVKLRPNQCELILNETQIAMAGEVRGQVEDALALQRHGWCSLSLTPDQVEELHGFVAAEANYYYLKKMRLHHTLQEICERLYDALDEASAAR